MNAYQYENLCFDFAGVLFNIDPLLLKAMGYQESRWNPEAVNLSDGTGSTGIMQMIPSTYNGFVGGASSSRYPYRETMRNPFYSIILGAAYLRQGFDHSFIAGISDPDLRAWYAVNGYNNGMGTAADVANGVGGWVNDYAALVENHINNQPWGGLIS